jgi:hypothetical protein
MLDADAVYIPEAERTYAEWLKNHKDGYVINAPKSGTQEMVWHQADCEHIQVYEDAASVKGARMKVCSMNPGALAVWAMSHGRDLHYCQTCQDNWAKKHRTP